jgi:hypothetical protein
LQGLSVQTGINARAALAQFLGVSKAKPGNKPGNEKTFKNKKPSIHAGFKPSFN